MDCNQFKKYWIDGEIENLDEDIQDQLFDHFQSCQQCSDKALKKTLEDRGINVEQYPCVHMAQYAEFYCEQHPDSKECDDAIILYDEIFNEYSIPHGDGISQVNIKHCPWCGATLPPSKRDEWFDTLEKMGFEDPSEQKIPEEFKSKKWRTNS